ncbi:MAG: hypothetical protein V3T58_05360 [Candidatus Hydrothermarchaeales archaeon]
MLPEYKIETDKDGEEWYVPIIKEQDNGFYNFICSKNFYFLEEVVNNYYLALKTKPFVILTGISGTGKTKIAQFFAEYMYSEEEGIPFIESFPENDETNFYWEVKKTSKDSWTVPVKIGNWFDMPELKTQKKIEILFDGKSQKCTLQYLIRGKDKGSIDQVGFKGELKKWITNLKVDEDTLHIEKIHGDKDKVPKLRFEKLLRKKIKRKEKRYAFISVRPEWSDNKGLLGFYNLLTEKYEPTEFLKLMLRAYREYQEKKEASKPYFVILDEMNLAKVEYYFSDFLSCLESRKIGDDGEIQQEPVVLHNKNRDLVVKGDDGIEYVIPPKIEIPPNLYFTGTVNIDETTYMFSPKVLDRANTIEFNAVNLKAYRDSSKNGEDSFTASDSEISEFTNGGSYHLKLLDLTFVKNDLINNYQNYYARLVDINEILRDYNLHFGYRVVNEILFYIHNSDTSLSYRFSEDEKKNLDIAFDLQILQKVLPKFHGSKHKLEMPLSRLLRYCLDGHRSSKGDVLKGILPDTLWNSIELEDNTPSFELKDEKNTEEGGDSENSAPREVAKEALYPRSAIKIYRMLNKLKDQGFVSFIE